MPVTVDLAGLDDARNRLAQAGKDADLALKRARGTLVRRLPVEARRDIQTEYALGAIRIGRGLSVRVEADAVVLTGAKRGVGLIEFGGRWGGRRSAGATAQVHTGGGRTTRPHTFIATGASGNRQIFERATIGGRRAGRWPIVAAYGPSVAQMLRRPGRAERLTDVAEGVLDAEIDRLAKT